MSNNLLTKTTTIENQASRVLIAAHRGWSSDYPENTLLAYQKALTLDIDMIELDIRLTKDGIPVIIHDQTIDRTTSSNGNVCDMTLAQLKAVDILYCKDNNFTVCKIPSFEEFLDFISAYPGLLLNVEIKSRTNDRNIKEIVDKTYRLLEKYGKTNQYVITSFNASVIEYAALQYGIKCQGFYGHLMKNFKEDEDGSYSHMYSVGVSTTILDENSSRFFKEKRIELWSYCPDKREQVIHDIELKSRLLTVNNPLPAIEVLTERKMR